MRTLTALALSLALVGCASQAVKDNVLFPAAIAAYAGIAIDIQTAGSPQDLVNSEIFKAALQSKDTVQLLASAFLWAELREVAERGIDMRVASGEITPGVAGSLRNRLTTFERTLIALGVMGVTSE